MVGCVDIVGLAEMSATMSQNVSVLRDINSSGDGGQMQVQ